ncbi:MAG: patatin-like phospholipase family protein [Acholeplasmataceae bacterium]|nr:patatin-like phospholipase family protein [Acholeplasmataceae bacterium]
MKHKIGLALGGGGARGSYQIGILKALDEANILKDIHHVSGTSIGAINTFMVMAKLSFDRMIEIWEKINNSDIYGSGPDRFKMDRLGIFSLQDAFNVLSREISLSEIRNSKIQGYATSAKIKKDSLIDQILIHRMKKEVFHLNDFDDPHKAVLASASIPVLFGSTTIGQDHYVDGGAVDNCPVQPLLDQNCDIVIAVPIDGFFRPKKYQDKNIILINLKTHHLFHTIPYDILDFKPDIVTDKVDYGYQMGKLMINKLKHLGYLNSNSTWNKPDGFTHINITKEEEKKMKEEV